MKIVGVLFCIILLIACSKEPEYRVSVVCAGDIMQHDEQIRAAFDASSGRYDYTDSFLYISERLKQADIAIGNLELTFSGEPYKGYPHFSAPDELAAALKRAGFNYLVTANNHSLDYGEKGLLRTIAILDNAQIANTGTFASIEERDQRHPLIIEKNGICIALLSFTHFINGLSEKNTKSVNYTIREFIKMSISKAREKKADCIIAYIHWGEEYHTLPSTYQKMLAMYCLEEGIDVVVGTHPHVLQPIVLYDSNGEKALVAYSLGNFISAQRTPPRDGGGLLCFDIVKYKGKVHIENERCELVWVHTPKVDGKVHYEVLPVELFVDDKGHLSEYNHTRLKKFTRQSIDILAQQVNE